MIDAESRDPMDEPTRFVTAPDLVPNALYDKHLFQRKLTELGINGTLTEQVIAAAGRPVHARATWSRRSGTSCGTTGRASANSSRSPTR